MKKQLGGSGAVEREVAGVDVGMQWTRRAYSTCGSAQPLLLQLSAVTRCTMWQEWSRQTATPPGLQLCAKYLGNSVCSASKLCCMCAHAPTDSFARLHGIRITRATNGACTPQLAHQGYANGCKGMSARKHSTWAAATPRPRAHDSSLPNPP